MSVKEKVEEKVEENASPIEKPEPALLTCRELEQVIDRRVRKVICKIATDTLMVIGIALCISALLRDY